MRRQKAADKPWKVPSEKWERQTPDEKIKEFVSELKIKVSAGSQERNNWIEHSKNIVEQQIFCCIKIVEEMFKQTFSLTLF